MRHWYYATALVAIAALAVVGLFSLDLLAQKTEPPKLPDSSRPDDRASEKSKGSDVALTSRSESASKLPVTKVVLFNSGVGYFERSGEIDGDVRVDLSFPVQDINDMLKSMVVQDLGGGQVSAISFDSQAPVDKTLRSFAIDLSKNPTFAQIMDQSRGERVEVILQQSNTTQPGTMNGAIIGIEKQKQQVGKDGIVETEFLNLWCTEGMRSIKLSDVQRVRFLNSVMESEFKKALDVVTQAHDTQKKAVSLNFTGKGQRKVKVGYVVENPIWKTSYRLVLDKEKAPFLQGWAVVENNTDEDWNSVGASLMSGRPISFTMDLYQPLYVPRPHVEPELFASLRPPTYSGDITTRMDELSKPQIDRMLGARELRKEEVERKLANLMSRCVRMLEMQQAVYRQTKSLDKELQDAENGAAKKVVDQKSGEQSIEENKIVLECSRAIEMLEAQGSTVAFPEAFRQLRKDMINVATRLKSTDVGAATQNIEEDIIANLKDMITDLKKEKKAEDDLKLAEKIDLTRGITSAAQAMNLGDTFSYDIDHAVSLGRQKSAVIPIINHKIEAGRVSIYNEGAHPKFPLLGLRFKNNTDLHLTQGPITVFDGSNYAGDARILDLQPKEERLISYAVDLGTEVMPVVDSDNGIRTSVKIVKGVIQSTFRTKETKTYTIVNRSEQDRIVLVEHPFRSKFKLVGDIKPIETASDVYRFQVNVAKGKTEKLVVTEERDDGASIKISNSDDNSIQLIINEPLAGKEIKDALLTALKMKSELAKTLEEIKNSQRDQERIKSEQPRLRENLKVLPDSDPLVKKLRDKLLAQENEIEKYESEIKLLQAKADKQRQEFESYLVGLTIER